MGPESGMGRLQPETTQPQASRCGMEHLERRAGGEAPGWKEEARVGVTGRLWVAGRLDDPLGMGWGLSVYAEHHGLGEQWNRYTTRSCTHSPTHTHTRRHAQNTRVGGPASVHSGTRHSGWHPGPISLKPAGRAQSLRTHQPQFPYLLNGDNNNPFCPNSLHLQGTYFLPGAVLGILHINSFTTQNNARKEVLLLSYLPKVAQRMPSL